MSLAPGATIGILGGGQLGRMIALAAADLGLRAHVYAPEADQPAFDVAAAFTCAAYGDEDALARFAAAVDVVTYEFENVPEATAALLARLKPVRPGPSALAAAQDRLVEKRFLEGLGAPVAPFADAPDETALREALARFGGHGILKTRRLGYDGKGQVRLRPGDDPRAALDAIEGAPAILEALVPFAREISVVAARGIDGAFAAWDPGENEHADHVLSLTRVPARTTPATSAAAVALARRILDALDCVGVMGVELFVVGRGADERLVVNEIAPRVHNSGHWTDPGAVTSQFEQHVRAICGWPLGSTARRGRIEMRNLLGDGALGWRDALATPDAHLRLYGKRDRAPGRKMGHVTRIFPEV
ncbi:MAG: 5-(carboxyamino)imidazole ribonucleotide synthase [Hyphomicrobiales bacterium]|nr:5-(carboxyamino)imidazole ribonucleotide synthase [Hyphomicrobiales bacterium]MDE2016272.1 5-(carboxyamino)imidazole ribonucleotide synthase [Hyphomicrobiales bacterium]